MGWLRAASYAAAVSGIACAAFIAAASMSAFAPWLPITSTMAALVVIATPLTFARARRTIGPRAPVALALGLLALMPVLAFGALEALDEPLASSFMKCGTPRAMLMMASPFAVLAFTLLGGLLSTSVLGAARHRPAPLDRLVDVLAMLATLTMGAMIVVATFGALRRPEPSRWADGLRVETDVDGLDANRWQPIGNHERLRLENGWLVRTCRPEGWCTGTFSKSGEPSLDPHGERSIDLGVRASRIVVKHDDAHDLVLLEVFPNPGPAPLHVRPVRAAVRASTGAIVEIRPHDLAGSVSAPRPWIVGALAGFIGAALMLARHRRLRARALDAERYVDASVVAGRAAQSSDDERRFRLPDGFVADPGERVVVVTHGARKLETFRDDGTPDAIEIVRGTREVLLHDLFARASTWSALALALVALVGTPLLATWLHIGLMP